jgi:putative ABC transport system substrate-binding protein
MNRRRAIIAAIAASAFFAPFTSFAQVQGKVWRVGFLAQRSRPISLENDSYGAFVRGMRQIGYVEGKHFAVEWRFADGKVERLPELAAELVVLKVDVIVTSSTPATSAAQKATTTIPIIMGPVGDPVGSGFIKSLARPEGNITGLTNVLVELSAKHLEMLHAMVPKLARVSVMGNPDNASNFETLKSVEAAARRSGVKISFVAVRTAQDIEAAFPTMARGNTTALIIAQDGLFIQQRRQIADLAIKYRLPSIGAIRELAVDGVLLIYGPSFADIYRRAAIYADKIFKGAKPGDLPVEQPTTFDLVINHRTAKALGLTIPQSLLIRADKVIE